jgi:hypothetical protein
MKADKIILSWNIGSIADLYIDAVEVAKQFKCPHVEFPFNGIRVIVTNRSNQELTGDDVEFILDSVRDKQDAYL